MSDPLAKLRRHHRPADIISGPEIFAGQRLMAARTHEACGPARQFMACLVGQKTTGPILWIAADHGGERLHPAGMLPWFDPARLTCVSARRSADILWVAEEALRSGAVPLVVAEMATPPALTPVRRLHLAAQAGKMQANGARTPLGLLLTPGTGGAQGVESRWHMVPHPGWAHGSTACHRPGPARWTLTRLRARTAPQAKWLVTAPPRPGAAPTLGPCPADGTAA